MRFLYVMDPMCAWCYAFQPELEHFLAKQPSINVEWVMGGLAPDTDKPMDESLKQTISSYWYQIEKKTQVTFNHDFWKLNTPFRSSYAACRAVISAEYLKANNAQLMTKAIQSAYYLNAKNPSLKDTLIECAVSIGLDKEEFKNVFESRETEQQLQRHLGLSYQLQVSGFPAFFCIDDKNNKAYPMTLGFCKSVNLEQQLRHISF